MKLVLTCGWCGTKELHDTENLYGDIYYRCVKCGYLTQKKEERKKHEQKKRK